MTFLAMVLIRSWTEAAECFRVTGYVPCTHLNQPFGSLKNVPGLKMWLNFISENWKIAHCDMNIYLSELEIILNPFKSRTDSVSAFWLALAISKSHAWLEAWLFYLDRLPASEWYRSRPCFPKWSALVNWFPLGQNPDSHNANHEPLRGEALSNQPPVKKPARIHRSSSPTNIQPTSSNIQPTSNQHNQPTQPTSFNIQLLQTPKSQKPSWRARSFHEAPPRRRRRWRPAAPRAARACLVQCLSYQKITEEHGINIISITVNVCNLHFLVKTSWLDLMN